MKMKKDVTGFIVTLALTVLAATSAYAQLVFDRCENATLTDVGAGYDLNLGGAYKHASFICNTPGLPWTLGTTLQNVPMHPLADPDGMFGAALTAIASGMCVRLDLYIIPVSSGGDDHFLDSSPWLVSVSVLGNTTCL